MDDELEDKIIYQTYSVHMKLLSKLAVDFSLLNVNTYFSYLLHIMRFYLLKPEFIFIGTLIFVLIYFLIANQANNRSLLQKIQDAFGHTTTNVSNFQLFINKNLSDGIKLTWESKQEYIAAYAVQGHRAHMEDRFVINTNINNTGVSLFAIFDGHGGEFAANYARDNLVPSIKNKVIQLKNMLDGKIPKVDPADNEIKEELNQNEIKENKNEENLKNRKKSFRKTISTDDYKKKSFDVTDSTILEKLDSLKKTITREVRPTKPEDKIPVKVNLSSYLDGDKINYSKLLFDEVLAIDRLIVEEAKKNMDVAGTTALIALLEGNKLIVANVGDSRGVMCDGKGNVIPLSFDHKPQQQRERIRINKAGGLVIFNGVWRVAGILATSRALGDYPLKDKKLVIAEPDILTFDLVDHNPMFFILATDGLWDTFSNEEAVSYIKNHINEPYYGAKSITLQSYYRGSLDNITVLVINLRDRTNYFESVKK